MEIRPLREWEEYRACQRLQEEIWGEEFSEITPASVLKIGRRIGGVSSGAFDPDGGLVGFVFGLTGPDDGSLLHWSHMLAVRRDRRGEGLGRRLKEHQRELLLSRGVRTATWTYDPLVARNAHFNLNLLGAEVAEYVPDMYGETGSRLHRGLGTDRFRVVWDLDTYDPGGGGRPGGGGEEPDGGETEPGARDVPGVEEVAGGGASEGMPGMPGTGADPEEPPVVRVEIPADIQAVRDEDREAGRRWRERTREELAPRLAEGYRVAGFVPGPERGFYVLVHPAVS